MTRLVLVALGLCCVVLGSSQAVPPDSQSPEPRLGRIAPPSLEVAKRLTWESLAFFAPDPAVLQQAEGLWDPALEMTLLDRVAESVALVDKDARELLSTVRSPLPPGEIPEYFKNPALPAFVRANVGLAYARQLINRRVNEEALEILRTIRPEQVVDPAAFYFYKAVAENRLLLKQEGLQSLDRLLKSVAEVPERYVVLAGLMKEEMQTWKDKDLGYVARRMGEVESRLDNARGGPKTQAKQKEIIDLLDKEIEQLEQQLQACCAAASSGGTIRPSAPMPDSRVAGGAGPGNVDKRKLLKTLEIWGKLPEKERIKALEAIKRELPPHYQEAIEGYLKELARGASK